MPTVSGSWRLFRFRGINVFVHWSWALVFYIVIRFRQPTSHYSSYFWLVAEYLGLFGIVLLHEFGHALACRSVGGLASTIVLWPLGGVAYVSPPPRPGPLLWSIAAGPLVNLLLVPVTVGLHLLSINLGWDSTRPDLYYFLWTLTVINLVLFVFNMLPIYPLDGGQILQALLWFVIGRAKSLLVASSIGLFAGCCMILLGLGIGDYWLAVIALFVTMRSYSGLQQGRQMHLLLQGPRHLHFNCPFCQNHPLMGDLWTCNNCGTSFDTFTHCASCPSCGTSFPDTMCVDCGRTHPMQLWRPHVRG